MHPKANLGSISLLEGIEDGLLSGQSGATSILLANPHFVAVCTFSITSHATHTMNLPEA